MPTWLCRCSAGADPQGPPSAVSWLWTSPPSAHIPLHPGGSQEPAGPVCALGADRGWIHAGVRRAAPGHRAARRQASEPYPQANGSGLVVPQGGQGTIDIDVLPLDTNLDIRSGGEVHYQVTAGPRWGQLLRAGQPVTSFTQQDLLKRPFPSTTTTAALVPLTPWPFCGGRACAHGSHPCKWPLPLRGPVAPAPGPAQEDLCLPGRGS